VCDTNIEVHTGVNRYMSGEKNKYINVY